MDQQPQQITPHEDSQRHRKALVFISHDTRDAEIAEAFSRLLSSVSAGVLKSFRSSDKKGNQGIEYGVEWYPEVMKKLETASDVVCLLTPNSVNRPWLLYEAGVAKGKLDTPVHGVELGIPLHVASTGPFAQFQNCDDAEDSLTSLVIQLVGRIPNAEPDRDVVKIQVEAFKQKISPLFEAKSAEIRTKEEADEASIAKIFEEIKVMFQDLPGRIERRIDPESSAEIRRRRKIHPHFLDKIMHIAGKETGDPVVLLIVCSLFKDDFPWLYEIALDVYRKFESRSVDAPDALKRFVRLFEIATHHPMFREFGPRSRERRFELEETMSFALHTMERTLSAIGANPPLNTDAPPSGGASVS